MSGLKAYLAEALGTFVLVFAGAGAVCLDAVTGGRLGAVGIALAPAFALLALSAVYAPVSGAHFNPALTASLLANHRLDAIKAVFYVASQLLGAALAALLLACVWRQRPELASSGPFLGACGLNGVDFKAATLLEALGAFVWTTAYYATHVDSRDGASGAASVAAALAFGTLVLGPLTGAAMNPARAFGPAVVSGHWDHWYVYWIGPAAGAAAAGLLYELLYLQNKNKVTP
jgi:MIP family channel proteins